MKNLLKGEKIYILAFGIYQDTSSMESSSSKPLSPERVNEQKEEVNYFNEVWWDSVNK